MTNIPFCHGMFTIKRQWAAPPALVFSAWSDPALKAQWFTGPADVWTLQRRSVDFRPGGIEVLEGRFSDSGATTLFEARFHLIESDRRLVYAYDLHHGESFGSVTLASLMLEQVGSGTLVSYTEQIIFLDGTDGTKDRQLGTELQFAQIEAALKIGPTT